jgi:hypothetical protein
MMTFLKSIRKRVRRRLEATNGDDKEKEIQSRSDGGGVDTTLP